MISPVLFYLTAFVVIFGALMMVAHKNILYSALSMVLCFIGVAGVYATLQLSFFAGIVAVLVAVVMAIVIRTISLITPQALPEDWIQQIGVELFGTYVLPVELVALLLLVGMIGAIVIGKEDDGR